MGKPINKKYFGDNALAGEQIEINAQLPGHAESTTAYHIVKQKSNTTYLIEHTASGDRGFAKLVNKGTSLEDNEMSITVSPFLGGAEYVRIINAHQVKTFSGNVYKWDALVSADSYDEADVSTS